MVRRMAIQLWKTIPNYCSGNVLQLNNTIFNANIERFLRFFLKQLLHCCPFYKINITYLFDDVMLIFLKQLPDEQLNFCILF